MPPRVRIRSCIIYRIELLRSTGVERHVKGFFLQGVLPIQRDILVRDVLAGVTLAALSIPEVMGYTKIIGTPLITGLYTLVFPVLAFAVLGSSRHLVVGADSATAAIVASGLLGIGKLGGPDYVGLTSLVALLAGALILTARIFDLGFLANFLSRTVLIGFLSGVGVQVALGQIDGMLGMETPPGAALARMAHTLSHVGDANVVCVAIILTVLAVLAAFGSLAPRWPGALITVVAMSIGSRVLNLGQYGVQMVGQVPQGLPHLYWPEISLGRLSALFSMSFSCAVVILAQSAATARAYAMRDNDLLDENADLVGLAVGNLASALSGSFVVNGSPTKTAIVDSAGGRSQVAQITMAALVILVLLFLTGPLAALPTSVLSAVVFIIGIKLVDRQGMTDLFHRNRFEFWLALLTAGTVVVAGVMPGIVLALVMSLLYHVRTSYKPQTALLSPSEEGHWLPNIIGKTPIPQPEPGMVVYWFGADLFYANVNHFAVEVMRITKSAPLRWLVIDAGSITAVDYSADRAIDRLSRELSAQSIELVWVHVRGELGKKLRDFKIFESLHDCLAEYRRTFPKIAN
jgi:SulP family sulfate permease